MASNFTVEQIQWLYSQQTEHETYTSLYTTFKDTFIYDYGIDTFKTCLKRAKQEYGVNFEPAKQIPLLLTEDEETDIVLFMYRKLLNGETSCTVVRKGYNETHEKKLTYKKAQKYFKQALMVYDFHSKSVIDKDVEWLNRYRDCLDKVCQLDNLIINALRGAFVQSSETKTITATAKIPEAVERHLIEGGIDPEILTLVKHQKTSKNVDITSLERCRIAYVSLSLKCLENLPISTNKNPIYELKDKGYTVTKDKHGNITGKQTETISAALDIPKPQNVKIKE